MQLGPGDWPPSGHRADDDVGDTLNTYGLRGSPRRLPGPPLVRALPSAEFTSRGAQWEAGTWAHGERAGEFVSVCLGPWDFPALSHSFNFGCEDRCGWKLDLTDERSRRRRLRR